MGEEKIVAVTEASGEALKEIRKIAIIILISCSVTFILAFFIIRVIYTTKDDMTIDVEVVEENLRLVAELTTLTYHYSDVGKFSEQKTISLFGKEIGIVGTSKSFIITYDGEMKFGIDMSQISIESNGNKLIVKLPPAQIFSHDIKEESIKLLDDKTGLFTSFEITDLTDFMVAQRDIMETRVLESNLLEQAYSNAEVQIESLILSIPGIVEEYEIEFVH